MVIKKSDLKPAILGNPRPVRVDGSAGGRGGSEGGRGLFLVLLVLVLRGGTLLAYLSVCLTPCQSRAATGVHQNATCATPRILWSPKQHGWWLQTGLRFHCEQGGERW